MATQAQGRKFVRRAREESIPVEQIQAMLGSPLFPLFLKFNFDEAEKAEDEFRKIGGLPPNSFITINRSQPLQYPDWVRNPLYPELESRGPKRINLDDGVEQWLHPEQEKGCVKGTVIHEYLKDHNLLPTCLGFRELLAIQAKGVDFFRRHFQGKAVFGWKGVVLPRDGNLHVPCLIEDDGEVVLYWYWLESGWNAYYPALRLTK